MSRCSSAGSRERTTSVPRPFSPATANQVGHSAKSAFEGHTARHNDSMLPGTVKSSRNRIDDDGLAGVAGWIGRTHVE